MLQDKTNLSEIISKAGDVIRSGGIVNLPFDTVYGFVCDPKNSQAIARIFELKNRPENKTIGLAVSGFETLEKTGECENFKDFIKGKVPGRFTFILEAKEKGFASACYKNDTIAIRLPDSDLIRKIARECGGIMTQTSANKSGQPNCYSFDDLQKQFSANELNSVDLIIDAGPLPKNQPSEIWDLTGKMPVKIERK